MAIRCRAVKSMIFPGAYLIYFGGEKIGQLQKMNITGNYLFSPLPEYEDDIPEQPFTYVKDLKELVEKVLSEKIT